MTDKYKPQPLAPINTEGLEDIAEALLAPVQSGNPENSGENPGTHIFYDGFVYIPTINRWFTEELSLNGKNWTDCHKELAKQKKAFPNNSQRKLRMPYPFETWQLVLYAKEHLNDQRFRKIYDEILKTKPKNTWRGEWQNAKFIQGTGFNNLNLETTIDVNPDGS